MYPLLFVFLSPVSAVLLDESMFFAMFSQCSVTVTMFRYNVFQQYICNLLYAWNRIYVLLGLLRNSMQKIPNIIIVYYSPDCIVAMYQ